MNLKQKTLKDMTEQEREANPEYTEFLSKFEPKYTSDDCFTPPGVYDAVKSYVVDKYNLDEKNFVRPFYPGGDYENYEYSEDCVVVDNPPFSILSKIIKFYAAQNIKFFLFAPALTFFSSARTVEGLSYIIADATIIYQNGAGVATGFITNCAEEPCICTAPSLNTKLKAENRKNSVAKPRLRYEYPPNILTATMLNPLANNGIELTIPLKKCQSISALDAQRPYKKAIFGRGFIVADEIADILKEAKAEAQAQARAKAQLPLETDGDIIKWTLSDAEREIVQELNLRQ